jgi:hypothetical protein
LSVVARARSSPRRQTLPFPERRRRRQPMRQMPSQSARIVRCPPRPTDDFQMPTTRCWFHRPGAGSVSDSVHAGVSRAATYSRLPERTAFRGFCVNLPRVSRPPIVNSDCIQPA